MRGLAGAVFVCFCATPATALPPAHPVLEPLDHAVCRLIETAARAHRLPAAFMTRVIWRESSFRSGAVSPVGAQGIAQFMPGTARERGLADPFDPEQAIPKAAELLAELRSQFGSLGLAAAAYNAGPARVASWLRGESELPAETRGYVRFVMEEGGDAAPGGVVDAIDPEPQPSQSCVALIEALRRDRGGGDEIDSGPFAPWGVQLAGNFSKARALAAFGRARARYATVVGDERPMILGRLLRSRGTRRFYQIRLPASSRQAADALCRRIQVAGGACIAMRS